ncbi:metallophosphoesterase [Microbulbifer sp. CNSA002]|uniref:metallophosphoesterase n=1 Tax=Microbulbifer sp. CNSA002 TaxID=3373604 RepID=UPI0039B3CFDE
MFEKGLEQLSFDPTKDRVISVGDLVDKGPDSLSCLKLIENEWFYGAVGNHERSLYHYAKFGSIEKSTENLWARKLSEKDLDLCASLIEKMYWAIEIDNGSKGVGVVHSGVPTSTSWNQFRAELEKEDRNSIEYATWSRLILKSSTYYISDIDWVFIGHQAIEGPSIFGNHICIDSAVFVPRRYGAKNGLTFSYIREKEPVFITIPTDY